MKPGPVTLEGIHVRLEPLEPRHAEDLWSAASDESIWRYMTFAPLRSIEDVQGWIDRTLAAGCNGAEIPFSIIDRRTLRAVGATRYMEIRPADRALEIGGTWLGPDYQRTAINTECKYLLLRHAFEELGAVRVQLKTDGRNERSQKAIERIGARREGVLRKHMTLWDGHIRDTVYFSILDDEWPAVRLQLEEILLR